jgi:hypothetical protein
MNLDVRDTYHQEKDTRFRSNLQLLMLFSLAREKPSYPTKIYTPIYCLLSLARKKSPDGDPAAGTFLL